MRGKSTKGLKSTRFQLEILTGIFLDLDYVSNSEMSHQIFFKDFASPSIIIRIQITGLLAYYKKLLWKTHLFRTRCLKWCIYNKECFTHLELIHKEQREPLNWTSGHAGSSCWLFNNQKYLEWRVRGSRWLYNEWLSM